METEMKTKMKRVWANRGPRQGRCVTFKETRRAMARRAERKFVGR